MSPAAGTPAKAKSRGYFSVSRAPRYSVIFALPLLLGYEGLAALQAPTSGGQLVNGADALFRAAFTAVAGPRGGTLFMGLVILIGVVLVVRDVRRSGERPRPIVFAGMLGESIVLAALFGVVVGGATAKLLGGLHLMAIPPQAPLANSSWSTRLMLSLGAGLFEELFFRVVLVGGIAAGLRLVLGFGRVMAGSIAAVTSALIFSAFHYIGPYGDTLTLASFTFRAISGVVFSVLYLTRGFGITAWTHALYDAMLLVG